MLLVKPCKMDYVMSQNKAILKQLRTREQPEILSLSRKWIRSLQVGDTIETDRDETLFVVRDFNNRRRKFSNKDVVLVKRSHRSVPAVLRSCQDFDNCIEMVWSQNDGWKQSEFCNWKVIRTLT